MFHLNTISWAQVILIQTGVIFQIIALWAILKGSSGFHGDARQKKDELETRHDEELDQASDGAMLDRDLAGHGPRQHAEAQRRSQAAPSMRTSKVKFKQSFKFREQPSHMHHRIEH